MPLRLTCLVAALCLAGCDRTAEPPTRQDPSPTATQPATQPDDARPFRRNACPMLVDGTRVEVEDTANGVEMVFTTSGDVTELRQHVGHMAGMYEHRGEMHWERMQGRPHGGMGPGPMHGAGPMAVPAEATYEVMEGGARLRLTPQDPDDLQTLREQVRAHQERMMQGECPMWGEMPPEGV